MQQVLQILLKTKLLVSEGIDGDSVVTLHPNDVVSLYLQYKKYVSHMIYVALAFHQMGINVITYISIFSIQFWDYLRPINVLALIQNGGVQCAVEFLHSCLKCRLCLHGESVQYVLSLIKVLESLNSFQN